VSTNFKEEKMGLEYPTRIPSPPFAPRVLFTTPVAKANRPEPVDEALVESDWRKILALEIPWTGDQLADLALFQRKGMKGVTTEEFWKVRPRRDVQSQNDLRSCFNQVLMRSGLPYLIFGIDLSEYDSPLRMFKICYSENSSVA
jgi:hypothetical protein